MSFVKILKPAENDADYVEAMLPAGSKVAFKHEMQVTTDGQMSNPQQIISGQIQQVLREKQPIVFDTGENTSPIEKILVTPKVGDIVISTQESIYKLVSIDDEAMKRKVTLDYLKKGLVNFNQKLPNGFTDGGRRMRFYLTDKGDLVPVSPNREIIVVDDTQDEKLAELIKSTKEKLAGLSTEKEKIFKLVKIVSQFMGGQGVRGIIGLMHQDIASKINENGKVNIGDINYGVCRHRAILFKKLSDECGLGSRLVRGSYEEDGVGGGHAWNVVHIENEGFMVVDVMHDDNNLYPENSEKAKHYMRKTVTGEIIGGIGGQSVMSKPLQTP